MKLSKFLAHAGLASRRKAEDLIRSGDVAINGVSTTNVAMTVEETDQITFKGKPLLPPKEYTTIAFYKPAGVVTTMQDEQGRETIMDLLPKKFQTLKPIGRLDKNSEGLMLLTNDGQLHNFLTHPRYEKEKEYIVTVKGTVLPEEITTLQKGVMIVTEEGAYKTKPASIPHIEKRAGTTQFHLIIKEGKKRQIRLMCTAIGHTVTTLKRVRIGAIHLQGLTKGKWRMLSSKELTMIREGMAGKSTKA